MTDIHETKTTYLHYDGEGLRLCLIGDRVRHGIRYGVVEEFVAHLLGVKFEGDGAMMCMNPRDVKFISRERESISQVEATEEKQFSGVDAVTKETNPKDRLAGLKPRWFSFVPLRVLIGVGKAMFEGAWKYGKHNYRDSGVLASVYIDACVCGHLMPFMEGQDFDENGMHHIDKAIASLMVLRDSQLGGNWIDDRPQKAPGFDEQVAEETTHFLKMKDDLRRKFGDPVEPYTEVNRNQPRKKS